MCFFRSKSGTHNKWKSKNAMYFILDDDSEKE